ncbi:ATP-dependent zinc metalloprotease FtsH [Papillibacter cinnamivorans]|uniref:ATP-dependent zinc metalloprotease FtsH n=1 Tax=Papillibacter cinnamivorans DSM 12816 TaxID=1122930 RepID=A0A1W2BVQ4_9FIRM|nr:ATP-dependent zinc metalloprotease FtsH [Papillibacter cinnamivorans]SMC76989.1 cell division protease FtsH [Papillibacter cinnamivorans DSM 12816]
MKPKKENKNNYTGIVAIVLWALFITLIVNYMTSLYSSSTTREIKYNEFVSMVRSGQVDTVEIQDNMLLITPKQTETDTTETGTTDQKTEVLYTGIIENPDLLSLLDEYNVTYFSPVKQELSPIISFLVSWILPMLILFLLFNYLMRNMSGKMGGGIGGFGKSNAKVYVEKQTGVTFRDVAGQDEAKESLQEIIDFLHHPQKYTAIGAKLPRGALLVGSPGTGKTLLAKAVAGEANVPFFSISGSDFVEMFVGVGASRVRDLFQQAAKMAPAIIFIDEIDTIGKSRDSRFGGGNDEREQTLNQLLAELDGFDTSKGLIVLAATNRPEVLDKALLRPGRFDRRITVDRPNLAGRLATLQVHTRGINLAEDVDLTRIAQATAGAVGADLANLVNEAALRAVRLGRHAVNQEDLLVSFELVIAGSEKKGTVLTEQEKRIIAYHEVGHALVAAKQKHAQPVQKITIVPHTHGALGYTMQLPEEEKFLLSKDDILTEIRTLVAGRAAEMLVFSIKTSGAANDIERATDLTRKMITTYGMSDRFGMVALGNVQNQYLEGNSILNCAQETSAAIDKEVMEVISSCLEDSKLILQENRDMLDKIAEYLLQKETITGAEMMAILEGKDPALVEDAFKPVKRIGTRPKKSGTKGSSRPASPAPEADAEKPEEAPAAASAEEETPLEMDPEKDASNKEAGHEETEPGKNAGEKQPPESQD